MIVERIRPEHIPRIVSNKPIMEHFLRVLLDKPVTLSDWPSEASCSDFSAGPDLCAVTTGGMRICLHVNLFGSETMMDELMHAAAQYFPDPVCTIVLTAFDPVDLGQAYCRIAPMAVDAPVITELESVWQIHVLSFAAEIVNRNAPPEIQQLLDHMAGKEIPPTPGSLLDRMLHEDFVWCWLNGARYSLKGSYSSKYEQYAQQYPSSRIDYIMEGYSQEFIKGYAGIDVYTDMLQNVLGIAQSREELFAVCNAARIPEPMIQDAIAGKIWTQDDLLQWYETALAEEAERRRAAESENED